MTATILVVDDSATLRRQMCDVLAEADLDLKVVEATDGLEALPLALSGDVDIVLSDVVMPNLDGVGLLRGIRKQRAADDLPVILVTSETAHASRGQSFADGVNDYLTRPFSPMELITRIRVQLRLKDLQRELRRTQHQHKKQNSVDELTGLANRRTFLDLCRRELSRSRRHKLSMSVATFDIDRLNKINIEVGHRAGDALIREMADVVGRQLRSADHLARFDGGKFAALLPHTDLRQARIVCERICQSVAERAFPALDSGAVTMSLGLAAYPSGQIESVDELMNSVARVLDAAKQAGGNRVMCAADEPPPA